MGAKSGLLLLGLVVCCVELYGITAAAGRVSSDDKGKKMAMASLAEYIVTPSKDAVRDKTSMRGLLDQMKGSYGAEKIRRHRREGQSHALIASLTEHNAEGLRGLKGVESVVRTVSQTVETPQVNEVRPIESAEDGYILVLKEEENSPFDVRTNQHQWLLNVLDNNYGIVTKKVYTIGRLTALLVEGDALKLQQAKVALHGSIKYVEPNRKMKLAELKNTCYEQSTGDSLWGLTRSAMREISSYEGKYYPYSQVDNGTGVTAYVVDTGININHVDFENRASWGYTVPDTQEGDSDGSGHGTHVAGTIGGLEHGVAKGATVVAVKVFTSEGTGFDSWTLEGIEWVVTDFNTNGRGKAVINLSLTGFPSLALEDAIRNAVEQGIVVVAAAGNDNIEACNFTPARMSEVITVAASGRSDWFSSFSNYGSCVDIIAPGEDIISASHMDTTSTVNMQGTSMACPHVAGVVARYMSACAAPTPAVVVNWLISQSTDGEILLSPTGTPNKLLFAECLTTASCSAYTEKPPTTITTPSECETDYVLSNTEFQAPKHGDYHVTTSTCGTRTVYKHASQSQYLYYLTEFGSWIIGPVICGTSASLQGFGPDAETPDRVGSLWFEFSGTEWVWNTEITVVCKGLGSSVPPLQGLWVIVMTALLVIWVTNDGVH